MQFLTPNATEAGELLNDDNMQYKNDIDIKIIENSEIVGFIISTVSPVRFIGVKDFGCHGDVFEEYRLFLSQNTLEFIYDNEIQVIPITDIDESIDGVKPYIKNKDLFIMHPNTTTEITIVGDMYDSNVEIDFGPEITFNYYTLLEPKKLIANISSSGNTQSPYEIIMKRGELCHFGEKPTIEITDDVYGIGEAGTFITDFNNGGSGYSAWGNDWNLKISGSIDSFDGFFKTSRNATPSSGTGPISAYDGYYVFTERSGDNYGINQVAMATTNNFHILTKLEFRYHMYGSNIGCMVIESQNRDDTWTERWIQIGSAQSSQFDSFLYVNLDTTSWKCKSVRFIFKDTLSYSADVALDSIIFTSI